MRVHHMSTHHTVVQRGSGAGAMASSAYMDGDEKRDERTERTWRYTADRDRVINSAVVLPEGAPSDWRDPETLWNAAEQHEDDWARSYWAKKPVRMEHHIATARIAVKGHFTMADELGSDRHWEIAREWAMKLAEERGVAIQIAQHHGADGKDHVHFLFTGRAIKNGEFGSYIDILSSQAVHRKWPVESREWLAARQNAELRAMGLAVHIEHRSFEELGIDVSAEQHRGTAAELIADRGGESVREAANEKIRTQRRSEIERDPEQIINYLVATQATFTEADIGRAARRFAGEDNEVLSRITKAALMSRRVVSVGDDARGNRRFSTKEYLDTEATMFRAADAIGGRAKHRGDLDRMNKRLLAAEAKQGWRFTDEQRNALNRLVGGSDSELVVGVAGAGKTTILEQAATELRAAGFDVQGAALAGIAAANLQREAGILSKTLASYILVWKKRDEALAKAIGGDKNAIRFLENTKGYELTAKTIFVIDEAGMIDAKTLATVYDRAERNGAAVRLVGDPDQLSAIGAGDAFRGLIELQGAARLETVIRQKDKADQYASEKFSKGQARAALEHYNAKGRIVFANTRAAAKLAVVDDYIRDSLADPEKTRLIIAGLNADVDDINAGVRAALKEKGLLQNGVRVMTASGTLEYAVGDRIITKTNDKQIGVFNGSRGTITGIHHVGSDPKGREAYLFTVALDDGREIRFDSNQYQDHKHSFAVSVHAAQGATTDAVYHLADRTMYDRSQSYVGGTRHRWDYKLYAGQDDFKDVDALARAAGKDRGKTLAADFGPTAVRDRGPVTEYVAANQLVRALKMEIDRRQDADPAREIWKDEHWGSYQAALDARRQAATEIADNWQKQRDQAAPLHLHREDVERHAGRRIRPPTESEIAAEQRVIAYRAKSEQTRDRWNAIKAVAPGAAAKRHPGYAEFAAARQERDTLAAAIAADPRLHGQAVRDTEGASWKAIRHHAAGHAKRQAEAERMAGLTSRQKQIRNAIEAYESDRRALAEEHRRIRAEASRAGHRFYDHRDHQTWKELREQLDQHAAILVKAASAEVAQAEADNQLPAGEVPTAAARHETSVRARAYAKSAAANRIEARDTAPFDVEPWLNVEHAVPMAVGLTRGDQPQPKLIPATPDAIIASVSTSRPDPDAKAPWNIKRGESLVASWLDEMEIHRGRLKANNWRNLPVEEEASFQKTMAGYVAAISRDPAALQSVEDRGAKDILSRQRNRRTVADRGEVEL